MARIVIADDHTIFRLGVKNLVQAQADLQVVAEFGNVTELLGALKTVDWDLLLLDLNMPGLSSGIEVLKWIRKTPSACALPVIVLSSSNQEGDFHRAYIQGANGYLVKPSRIEDMVTMAKSLNDYWLVQNRGIL